MYGRPFTDDTNSKNDKDCACAWTVATLLFTPPTVSCTGTFPDRASGGVRIFTCAGLIKYTYAFFPFTVTLTPSSWFGNWLFPKSDPCQIRVSPAERFVPLISTHVFGA